MTDRANHFTVRHLLASVSAVAVVCGLVATYGLPGAVVAAAVVIVLFLAFRSPHWPVRFLLIVVASGLMWCLSVHRVFEVYCCETCRFKIVQCKYEIFTVPILIEEKRVPTMVTAIAEDFNCPCQHELMASWQRDDDWGMIMRYPRQSYYMFLSLESDEESYNKYVRPITQKILKEQPNLAKEFCTRVLVQHDEEYWIYFNDQVLKIPEIDERVRKERGEVD